MNTDTARALEHLRDAYYALDYATAYLSPPQGDRLGRIEDMREEISRLMHELEGEE